MKERVAIIGLGYVGLPVALAFASKFEGTVGFDINLRRVDELKRGIDLTKEVTTEELRNCTAVFSADEQDLKTCTAFIVAVPTPIDEDKRPDLKPILSASETVGRAISKGSVVVYESTVYPGVTEEVCGPILERVSGLKCGVDFTLGYSPERINPGDREHTLENVIKIVSGQDAKTLDRVADLYSAIVHAGVHRAGSIKVAEAAKVIENTQRDLNIALMNELAIIFDLMKIPTHDVLEAAGTKWNFLRFKPGLVGGHCIGVDPYYLTTKAEQLGYRPQVILAGRRINDGMGQFIAQRAVKLLSRAGGMIRGARVGILGITFKENVPDIRNSRVPSIIDELKDFGMEVLVYDPQASKEEVKAEYGLDLTGWSDLKDLDAVILAVSHTEFVECSPAKLLGLARAGGVFVDIKSIIPVDAVPDSITFWRL